MIDEKTIGTIEALHDSLKKLKQDLKARYQQDSQVNSDDLKKIAAQLGETWMVEIAQLPEVLQVVESKHLGALHVHFQRLLTFAEHSTKRSKYEVEINGILAKFTEHVIIPLKQLKQKIENGQAQQIVKNDMGEFRPTAFVGHSFSPSDALVVEPVKSTLDALGIRVVTGEKPEADRISDKVKSLILDQYLFVGIFTRRDKIARKNEWTTSIWVVDEKAFAVAHRKKLILLKEKGVDSIGGIQGDYEFIEFSRDSLEAAVIKLVRLFNVRVDGIKPD